MRVRVAASVLMVALMGCTRASALPGAGMGADASSGIAPLVSLQPWPSEQSPAPLVQAQTGRIQAVFPVDWQVRRLSDARFPHEGLVASPSINEWDREAGTVGGVEVFWVDAGKVGIPSDYYYLIARGPAMQSIAGNKSCRAKAEEVLLDRPPDLTGHRFSPGDYVAVGSGTCKTKGERTRWTYAVAAPGFGPVRQVGIPTSGLYVVVAVVSGPRSRILLEEMMEGARFGDASISQILAKARNPQ